MDKVSADDVVAPPYDVVTGEMKDRLCGKSPHNILWIDYGKEMQGDGEAENKYKRAARFLREWEEEGALLRSPEPAFYVYEMRYQDGQKERVLTGFMGLVRLVELGHGVYPHECTYSKPMKDRMSVLSECQANTSPIFSLYNSPEQKASKVLQEAKDSPPLMQATDTDGSVHSLWVLSGPEALESIQQDLADKAVYIADGHHRYETSINYKNSQKDAIGDEPFNYVLMFLANMADPDLKILPTHRMINYDGDVLKRLADDFQIIKLPNGQDIVTAISGYDRALGLYAGGACYVLLCRGDCQPDVPESMRDLDVTVLHEMIFKKLLNVSEFSYEMDTKATMSQVDSGKYNVAFFLNPTRVKDIERVALSLHRMPPKSTYFYPKLMTGFVINSFREQTTTKEAY